MIRTILIAIVAICVALYVSSTYEGAKALGVQVGFFFGLGITGTGLFYQRHTYLYRPERAFMATLIASQAKLLFLVAGTLTFRYVEAAGARLDWKSFAIAYTAAVLVILPIGTWEAAQVMGSPARKLSREPSPQ